MQRSRRETAVAQGAACAEIMRKASATIKGYEVMRMIRRVHCILQSSRVTGGSVSSTSSSLSLLERPISQGLFYPLQVNATMSR
jgi:hypothetical protein